MPDAACVACQVLAFHEGASRTLAEHEDVLVEVRDVLAACASQDDADGILAADGHSLEGACQDDVVAFQGVGDTHDLAEATLQGHHVEAIQVARSLPLEVAPLQGEVLSAELAQSEQGVAQEHSPAGLAVLLDPKELMYPLAAGSRS